MWFTLDRWLWDWWPIWMPAPENWKVGSRESFHRAAGNWQPWFDCRWSKSILDVFYPSCTQRSISLSWKRRKVHWTTSTSTWKNQCQRWRILSSPKRWWTLWQRAFLHTKIDPMKCAGRRPVVRCVSSWNWRQLEAIAETVAAIEAIQFQTYVLYRCRPASALVSYFSRLDLLRFFHPWLKCCVSSVNVIIGFCDTTAKEFYQY